MLEVKRFILRGIVENSKHLKDKLWDLTTTEHLMCFFFPFHNLIYLYFPGRRAEESYSGGVCKQAGHGPGNDAYGGGQRSGPSCAQRQKMANLQDISHKRHRAGRGNGMVGLAKRYRNKQDVVKLFKIQKAKTDKTHDPIIYKRFKHYSLNCINSIQHIICSVFKQTKLRSCLSS